jgi:hypothetical protein
MPKAKLIAPCERVIIDRETETLNLMSLLDGMKVIVPSKTGGLASGTVDVSWSFVVAWHADEGDIGKKFWQSGNIEMPDGVVIPGLPMPFEFRGRVTHTIANIGGFPAFASGIYIIHVLYKPADNNNADWVEAGSYPLDIVIEQEALC